MAFRRFHHPAELLFFKQGLHLPKKMASRLTLLFSGLKQLRKLTKLHDRPVVGRLPLIQLHVCNQDDLLPEIVKSDHLIKKHQIHVPELFRILRSCPHRRFAIAQIIVGKISHKTSGKGRQVGEPGTSVVRKHLPDIAGRVLRVKTDASRLHFPIPAGDLKPGIESQEGIASPCLILLCRLQQITVGRHIFQNIQRFDGRADIRQDFAGDRKHPVLSFRSYLSDLTHFR